MRTPRDDYAVRFRAFQSSCELPETDLFDVEISDHTATTQAAIDRAGKDFEMLERDKRGLHRGRA